MKQITCKAVSARIWVIKTSTEAALFPPNQTQEKISAYQVSLVLSPQRGTVALIFL